MGQDFSTEAGPISELEKIQPNGDRLAKHLKELAENFDKNGNIKILEAISHAS